VSIPRPAIHAHRGGSGLAPENTMQAFEAALALGVHWIELDVQTCATGELVVIHEPDLQRLGGVAKPVAALPLAELQSIDVGSHFAPAFAGARVPTLVEVLETFAGRVGLHVEVKEYGIRGDGTARSVASLLERMDLGERLLVSSYNVFSLARIRRACPRLPLGLVYPPSGGEPGVRRSLRDAVFGEPRAARWLHPRALVPGSQAVSRASVERAHAAGFEVHAGVVNDREWIRELAALGVDGVITDRPDVALEVLSSPTSTDR
jgi:glycerophosphoryl diester phosphodiesterase